MRCSRSSGLPHDVWEPACGSGNISKVLLAAGYDVGVFGSYSDYENFGRCGGSIFWKASFIPVTGAIVTNPPYQKAQAFVEKAL